ncbi:hypothetical protein BX666DRAFT_1868590 [Dichotomocladium elegans]|nr:hypothetical protein BX666DRAFT_1868590 [Dichotomocladium elegans]
MAPSAISPPSIKSSTTVSGNESLGSFDLDKWLKEVEGAESLMDQVESKADVLQAKVDALLAEMATIQQPSLSEAPKAADKESSVTTEK